MMTTCVVVVGNPFDGMTVYGPFDTSDEAGEFAEHDVDSNHYWWIVKLNDPIEDE